jgi:hypothetical protein
VKLGTGDINGIRETRRISKLPPGCQEALDLEPRGRKIRHHHFRLTFDSSPTCKPPAVLLKNGHDCNLKTHRRGVPTSEGRRKPRTSQLRTTSHITLPQLTDILWHFELALWFVTGCKRALHKTPLVDQTCPLLMLLYAVQSQLFAEPRIK